MTTPKREFWYCSWGNEIAKKKSKNGYCQKCFEHKLEQFISADYCESLEQEIAALREKLKDVLGSLKKHDEYYYKLSNDDVFGLAMFIGRRDKREGSGS